MWLGLRLWLLGRLLRLGLLGFPVLEPDKEFTHPVEECQGNQGYCQGKAVVYIMGSSLVQY